jgi:hypothetical protein
MILAWADAFYRRNGTWPHKGSGFVRSQGGKASGETWAQVNTALYCGFRGLPGNSSLARELRRCRGVYNRKDALDVRKIFAWARAHFERTGRWPHAGDGGIHEAPGENWHALDFALTAGLRGLRGHSSLSKLLKARDYYQRNKRRKNRIHPSRRLSMDRIMDWAQAHHQRTSVWPHRAAGPIRGARGLTWSIIDTALRVGTRGLPGGKSLARLFGRKKSRAKVKTRQP